MGVTLSAGGTLVVSGIAVSLPHALLAIFTKDPTVARVGAGYLRIVGGVYVAFAVMFASNGVINGAGHTLVTTLITLLSLWLVRVPLAYWLSHHLHSAMGIWCAMATSNIIGMLSSLTYYLSGRWRMPVLRMAPLSPLKDAAMPPRE